MRTLLAAAAVTLAGLSLAQAADEIVTIDGAERAIPATITLPEGEGPFPFVVMYHGTGSNRHEAGNGYDMLAPVLAAAGIASARFDFAGNGDSTVDYTEYTPASGVQDGRDVIAYMQGLDTIDDDRLGLLGWSQGGMIALLTASQAPQVKSVVTWAGVLDMSTYMADQYEDARANGQTVMEFDWREPLNLSIEWFDEVRAMDLTGDLANYTGALLAINGSADTVVVPTTADQIVAAAAAEPEETYIIEGGDHTFNIFSGDMAVFEDLMKTTTDWFSETL